MVSSGLWSALISLVVAGGITALFRARNTARQHGRVLFIMGLVSALSVLITAWSPPLVSGAIRTALVTLAMPMPALISILAGIGFRRAYHTRPVTFFAITGLMLSGLIFHTAPPALAAWSFWAGTTNKFILCGFLLHGLFSFWSGRHDDMDAQRLPRRYMLTTFCTVTLLVTLLTNPYSNGATTLLLGLWIMTTYTLHIVRTESIEPAFETYEEKLEELRSLFDRRHIYREDDLTLERIGDRLLLKNQAVRVLIHIGFGFRRLSNLLDHYRIADARIILEDVDQVEMKLDEIAISVGYGSIGPFEEAFRRLVGESAQGFRRRHLERANANRPLQLTNSDR